MEERRWSRPNDGGRAAVEASGGGSGGGSGQRRQHGRPGGWLAGRGATVSLVRSSGKPRVSAALVCVITCQCGVSEVVAVVARAASRERSARRSGEAARVWRTRVGRTLCEGGGGVNTRAVLVGRRCLHDDGGGGGVGAACGGEGPERIILRSLPAAVRPPLRALLVRYPHGCPSPRGGLRPGSAAGILQPEGEAEGVAGGAALAVLPRAGLAAAPRAPQGVPEGLRGRRRARRGRERLLRGRRQDGR